MQVSSRDTGRSWTASMLRYPHPASVSNALSNPGEGRVPCFPLLSGALVGVGVELQVHPTPYPPPSSSTWCVRHHHTLHPASYWSSCRSTERSNDTNQTIVVKSVGRTPAEKPRSYLLEQQLPQGDLVCDHAGLVISKFSRCRSILPHTGVLRSEETPPS